MKRLLLLVALTVLAAPGAASAKPVVVQTNWNEDFPFSIGVRHGNLRLHVRRRLLRIGFGVIVQPPVGYYPDGKPVYENLPIETTHQFKLPRLPR
jgi:hypothetical protein